VQGAKYFVAIFLGLFKYLQGVPKIDL